MMKITQSARKMFEDLLKNNGCDTIKIRIFSSSCCGKSIQIDLVDEKNCQRVVVYNELKISITKEDEKELEKVTFDCENGQIVIKNE